MSALGDMMNELMGIFQMEEEIFPSVEANPFMGHTPSPRKFSKGGFFRR